MKKLVTLLLSLALVLSLAACGGEATPDASDDAPASSQNEESTENDNTENQIVFEEVVAIDNAECAVKITEIDPDNMWGYTLKAQLENKSTEKTYMFSVESASINGVQCDPMFASEVAAGKKANEEINFSTDTLEENGIVEYTDIELTFKVYDSNDWSADPVGKETIHVYEELKTKRSEVKELQQIRKCIDIVEQAEQRTQEQTHQTPRRKKEDISL